MRWSVERVTQESVGGFTEESRVVKSVMFTQGSGVFLEVRSSNNQRPPRGISSLGGFAASCGNVCCQQQTFRKLVVLVAVVFTPDTVRQPIEGAGLIQLPLSEIVCGEIMPALSNLRVSRSKQ